MLHDPKHLKSSQIVDTWYADMISVQDRSDRGTVEGDLTAIQAEESCDLARLRFLLSFRSFGVPFELQHAH